MIKNKDIINLKYKELSGSVDSYNIHLVTTIYKAYNKTLFVCLPNLYEAQKYYDVISQIIDKEEVLFYPEDQVLTFIMALGSPEFKSERLFTLRQLLKNQTFIVITTSEGIIKRQLKPSDYLNSVKTITVNNTYNLNELTLYLTISGYKRVYTVENPGEFSLRGHILDIFTYDHSEPYRLDFFGDELEQIRIFDVETQKSNCVVDTLLIAPITELFFTNEMQENAIKQIKRFFEHKQLSIKEEEKLNADIKDLENRANLDRLNIYIPFFNTEKTNIFDFAKNSLKVYIEPDKMLINEETSISDLNTYKITMNGQSFLDIPFRLSIQNELSKADLKIYNNRVQSKDNYSLDVVSVNQYQGNLDLLLLDLMGYKDYEINIHLPSKTLYEEIEKFLHKKKALSENIKLHNFPSYGSFISQREKTIIIDENQIFGKKLRPAIKYRSVLNQAKKIRRVEDLAILDYVVHYDYGIGQYVGLKTMELSGNKRDYLQIIYADDEALYVPLDQIDLVLKYSNNEGTKPKLSKLGSKQWQKTKTQTKMKIKDLSDRLINLYAVRQSKKGFRFEKDNKLQQQFENDFQYQVTKDQERAIIETKFDMEQEKPMDRLICGDVGFGKTEVALRASFKAVLNQKQVLYLVPTTVLARQHYYTFKERFERYGGNIALLSRFVSKKRQNEIIEKLKKGYIDVVIGTHRLLSKDIVFKDLGLLIIDEEQRFGVLHKEKIREIKKEVDTLTLSATPIPRTLQMSMIGLKDLSMIETPPLNRYPVQTYVVKREDVLIKEAISREIARGGQVFYLYNRIEGIEGIAFKLNKLIPNARVAYAHGQMNKDELERVLSDFIDHDFDILVATTIIETGIDIPNTNTLIIHDADKLGLSQLYQIRGRVGRSDKIAYAYLLYESEYAINDEARKRLSAIQDFTALGSGYKIAMRDLSIRGAGDILGAEQSGFIDSVGIELYMKLLNEALTGIEAFDTRDTTIDEVYTNRHVDPTYIADDSMRIEIHKRVNDINSILDIENLKIEFKDRFGPISAELLLYMYEKLYKKLSSKIGIEKTIRRKNEIELVLSIAMSEKIDGRKLFSHASNFYCPVKLSYLKQRVHLTFDLTKEDKHWLVVLDHFLDNYLNK